VAAAEKITFDSTQAQKAVGDLVKKVNAYTTAVDKNLTAIKNLNAELVRSVQFFTNLTQAITVSTTALKAHLTETRDVAAQYKSMATATSNVSTNILTLSKRATAAATALGTASVKANAFAAALTNSNSKVLAELAAVNAAAASFQGLNKGMATAISMMAKKNKLLKVQQAAHLADTGAMKGSIAAAIQLALSWRNLVRIGVSFAGFRAFAFIARQLRESVTAAKEFDQALSEIQSVAVSNTIATSKWNSQLTALSNNFGIDRIEAAEASYQALSNQVVVSAEATNFLQEQVKLATVTLSSLDDAVAASSSVMNAFGLNASSANEITATLFKTVELGRLRLSEIADTLGRVSVLSAQLGVSFTEQQAAIAILTRRGFKANEAMTLLRGIFLKLTKPTERMKELFKEWGVTSGEAAIKTFGFAGILEKFVAVAKQGGEVSAEFAEIFGRLRPIVGALALSQADLNEEVLAFGSGGGDAVDAFNERMSSFSKRADIQLAQLKNSFAEGFGRPVLERIVGYAEALGGTQEALSALSKVLLQAATVYVSYQGALVVVTVAQRIATVATWANIQALIAQKFSVQGAMVALRGLIATQAAATLGITLVIAAVLESVFAWQRYGQSVEQAGQKAGAAFAKMGEADLAELQQDLANVFGPFEQDMDAAFRAFNQGIAGLRANNQVMTNQLAQDWKKVKKAIEESIEAPIEKAQDALKKLIKGAQAALQQGQGRQKLADDLLIKEQLRIRRQNAAGGAGGEDARLKAAQQLLGIRKELSALREKDAKQGLTQDEQKRGNALFAAEQRIENDEGIGKADDLVALRATIDNFAKLRTDLAKEGRDALAKGQLNRADALFAEVAAIEAELKTRIAEAQKLAEEVVVKGKDEEGQEIKGRVDEGNVLDTQARLLELEKERNFLVQLRIDAEKQFAAKQIADAQAKIDAAKQQQKDFDKLKEVLAQIDAFKGGEKDFGVLQQDANDLAGAAGLDNEAQLALFRQLNQQRLTLVKQAAAAEAAEVIKAAQAQMDAVTTRFKAAVQERKRVQAELNQGASQDVPRDVGALVGELNDFVQGFGNQVAQGEAGEQNQAIHKLKPLIARMNADLQKLQKARGFEAQEAAAAQLNLQIDILIAQLEKVDAAQPGFLPGPNLFPTPLIPEENGSVLIGAHGSGQTIEAQIAALKAQQVTLSQSTEAVRTHVEEEGDLQQALVEIKAVLDEMPAAWAAQGEAAGIVIDQQLEDQVAIQNAVRLTLKLLRRAAELQANNNPAFGNGIAHGGVNRIAHLAGGGRPSGIDSIPAMLADGESVNTRLATRQFSPLISAMQSAVPSYRDQAQNVSFGDVNLNVPSGTTTDQVEAIMQQLIRRTRIGLN
jgi:TP901 family phage tail tape measure protein